MMHCLSFELCLWHWIDSVYHPLIASPLSYKSRKTPSPIIRTGDQRLLQYPFYFVELADRLHLWDCLVSQHMDGFSNIHLIQSQIQDQLKHFHSLKMITSPDCVVLFIRSKWSERVNNLTTDVLHNYSTPLKTKWKTLCANSNLFLNLATSFYASVCFTLSPPYKKKRKKRLPLGNQHASKAQNIHRRRVCSHEKPLLSCQFTPPTCKRTQQLHILLPNTAYPLIRVLWK